MLIPMLKAERLHLVLHFSTEYHNFKPNIIILFWKNFVDIRSEDWLILFGEHINGKLFAVYLLYKYILCLRVYYIYRAAYRQTSILVVIPVYEFLAHNLPIKGT
jgi:hypothetical protein